MNIFLDSNIVIDFLQRRQPFFNHAVLVINRARKSGHPLNIAAHSIDNIVYIIRKKVPLSEVMGGLNGFLNICSIATVDENIIQRAVSANWKDFEDAVQYFCAIETKADLIVSRDLSDFEEQKIPVVTPQMALQLMQQ